MYRFILFQFFILIISNSAFSAIVKGRVNDSATGEELVGSTILIKELNKGAITGLDGSFIIKNLPAGNYSVSCSFIGYQTIEKKITIVEWYPVLGNHDYKGNTQAEIDYSKISRRWRLTDRYYTFKKKINDSVSARFIFLDTPPLLTEYQNKPLDYPDVVKQDTAKEMRWLKDVLENSKEQWVMVFGHHPVYSASQKHGNTPEMIKRVKPLLEKYHVQFYFCGHDHDFQHLREKGKKVEYIVTGT